MKQFNLTNILIVIILVLLVYLMLRPNNDNKYLDMIHQEKQELIKLIQANEQKMQEGFKSIKLIEKKEIYIKNYYNEIIHQLDSINTSADANIKLRQQLDSLGTARFN